MLSFAELKYCELYPKDTQKKALHIFPSSLCTNKQTKIPKPNKTKQTNKETKNKGVQFSPGLLNKHVHIHILN